MSVVCEQERPHRGFAEFGEEEMVGGVEQLRGVLGRAQLQEWVQAATGLPSSGS